MGTTTNAGPTGHVLAAIDAALDGFPPDLRLVSDADLLALVAGLRRLTSRLQATTAHVAGWVADAEVADRATGLPLASWLTAHSLTTRREAHRLIGAGRDLNRFPHVIADTQNGTVSFDQATAIVTALKTLPAEFSTTQIEHAQHTLLDHAQRFDSHDLGTLARHLTELIDPDGAEAREATRLDRELATATANRHLTFASDGCGSIHIRGSLPHLDAEPLIRLIDTYTHLERDRAQRTTADTGIVTPAMRRADALCALIAAHHVRTDIPHPRSERARIVVTLHYDALHARCVHAGLLRTGQPITAGQLRRLAADADLIPTVLGGDSQPLDIGRTRRLVTPTLRLALELRDHGCVFPGCHTPAPACHAHHITPWWAGGHTSLHNLALLCPHHHNLLEPTRHQPPTHRWHLTINPAGRPHLTPPTHLTTRNRR